MFYRFFRELGKVEIDLLLFMWRKDLSAPMRLDTNYAD